MIAQQAEREALRNIKQGNWLSIDNGLGSDTLVYLKQDESHSLGQGWFSAWFYNDDWGLDSADWGTFQLAQYPHTQVLSPAEVADLPAAVRAVSDPDYFKKQVEQLKQLKQEAAR